MELNLGFMVSGRGSNFKAILDYIDRDKLDASANVLISSDPNARALATAKARRMPFYCLNLDNTEKLDEAIVQTLDRHGVNLVVLAGYIKKVGHPVLEAYRNKILNIHPALLPKYGGEGMYGMKVHEAVIASGDTESGATIHLVTEEYDAGEILARYTVPRFANDTPETLARRVLSIEHVLYPQTLIDIQEGIISLD